MQDRDALEERIGYGQGQPTITDDTELSTFAAAYSQLGEKHRDLQEHIEDAVRDYISSEDLVQRIQDLDPDDATTVLEPDDSGQGNWIGAPATATYQGDDYLAVRERDPERRGHRVTVYRDTDDGYEETIAITADEMGVVSIERPAFVTGECLDLYLPVEHGENDWTIQKLDSVEDPAGLDSRTARDVLAQGATTDSETVKDPHIVEDDGALLMHYAGHDGTSEQAHLARSTDGEDWERSDDNPVLPRQDWHDHHTRVAQEYDLDGVPGSLILYEGSGQDDAKNTWNLRTGIGYRHEDKDTVIDLSRDGPVLSAPGNEGTALDDFGTLRYTEIRTGDGTPTLLFEMARDDGSFELREAELE